MAILSQTGHIFHQNLVRCVHNYNYKHCKLSVIGTQVYSSLAVLFEQFNIQHYHIIKCTTRSYS